MNFSGSQCYDHRSGMTWAARAFGAFFLLHALLLSGQEFEVPLQMQAVIFKKIFQFDKAMTKGEQVNILIVSSDGYSDMASQAAEAFSKAGFTATKLSLQEIGNHVKTNTVVYALMDGDLTELKKICVEHKIMSISGIASLVEDGRVAIALGRNEKGKPLIIVHLNRLREEGHEMASQVLKLSRVIWEEEQ